MDKRSFGRQSASRIHLFISASCVISSSVLGGGGEAAVPSVRRDARKGLLMLKGTFRSAPASISKLQIDHPLHKHATVNGVDPCSSFMFGFASKLSSISTIGSQEDSWARMRLPNVPVERGYYETIHPMEKRKTSLALPQMRCNTVLPREFALVAGAPRFSRSMMARS